MASKVMIAVDTETFSESSYPRIVGCKKCGNDAKKIRSFNNPVRDLMLVENKCSIARQRAVRYAIFFDIPSLRDFPSVLRYIFLPTFCS